jgi:hypothetical protein
MRHYTVKEVMEWFAFRGRVQATPVWIRDEIEKLVDQANRADEMERRYEQAMGNLLAEGLIGLAGREATR